MRGISATCTAALLLAVAGCAGEGADDSTEMRWEHLEAADPPSGDWAASDQGLEDILGPLERDGDLLVGEDEVYAVAWSRPASRAQRSRICSEATEWFDAARETLPGEVPVGSEGPPLGMVMDVCLQQADGARNRPPSITHTLAVGRAEDGRWNHGAVVVASRDAGRTEIVVALATRPLG